MKICKTIINISNGGKMNVRKIMLFVFGVLLLAGSLFAQTDKAGAVDTMYVEPYQIDAKNWGINVSLFNDEEIIAISMPLTFKAGTTKLVADSTVFTGGRADHFRVKTARPDTATQCLTIGLINDIGVQVPPMQPGSGRIATIFVSAIDDSEIKEILKVDSTTTPPGNSMQMVSPPVEEVVPVLVIKPLEKKK